MLIEVYSDLICPWCFIGKRQLDRALAEQGNDDVTLAWRAYQLYPELPAQGMERQAFLEARSRRTGGDGDDARRETARRLTAAGEQVGIAFDFEAQQVMPNTLLGHRLLALAPPERQHDLAELLFLAYFCEGRDIGDGAVLLDIAEAAGMTRAASEAALATDGGLAEVREQLELARAAGVSGVPFLILAGRFGIPGAQSPETFAALIDRARSRLADGH